MDQVRFAGCSSAFLHICFTYAFQPFLSRILEETDLTGADFQVTVRTGKNSRQKSAGYIPIKNTLDIAGQHFGESHIFIRIPVSPHSLNV